MFERRLTPMRALALLREVERANRSDPAQMKWALGKVADVLEEHVKNALRVSRRRKRRVKLVALQGGKRVGS